MMQNVVAEPLSDAWAVLQPRHHDPEEAKRADFLELFGGRSPRLSEGFARTRRKVMMPRDPLHGHDLYHPAVQDEILKEIGEQRPKVIWMSPPALTQVWRRRPPEGASQEQRRDRKREDHVGLPSAGRAATTASSRPLLRGSTPEFTTLAAPCSKLAGA